MRIIPFVVSLLLALLMLSGCTEAVSGEMLSESFSAADLKQFLDQHREEIAGYLDEQNSGISEIRAEDFRECFPLDLEHDGTPELVCVFCERKVNPYTVVISCENGELSLLPSIPFTARIGGRGCAVTRILEKGGLPYICTYALYNTGFACEPDAGFFMETRIWYLNGNDDVT